jgi:hypothetical protein
MAEFCIGICMVFYSSSPSLPVAQQWHGVDILFHFVNSSMPFGHSLHETKNNWTN